MADKKFKSGDVVTLNSESPKMTILHYEVNGQVKCIWYYQGEIKSTIVWESCLTLTN